MKVCRYCNTQFPDETNSCAYCGANEFDFICGNCKTRFSSGYCPNCGVKAGEKPRTCAKCGTRSFSTYCPVCGFSLIPQQSVRVLLSREIVTPSSRTVVGMVVLTVFLPFIGAWILLLDERYMRGLKLFALIYSAFACAMLLYQRSWIAGLICFAPIAGFGLKIWLDHMKKSA